jgi:hypothetical protein
MTAQRPTPERAAYEPAPVTKQYTLRRAQAEAFMVQLAQWDRIRRRVNELGTQPSMDWVLTGASTALSVGIGAVIAALALPSSKGTTLGAGVEPTLWAVGVGGIVVGLILCGVYLRTRRMKAADSSDICDEMDTIREAWQEREGETS